MKKKELIESLASFDANAHIQIGDQATSYVPQITVICGGTQTAMPYYCTRPPGHEGQCYCYNKNVRFTKD